METISASEPLRGRVDQMLAFAAVAESGSFTRAAERLHASKAFVSKQVAQLERALGVQLLHRTTRSVRTTESGALYLDYCRQLRETLDESERALSAVSREVSGRIRVTAAQSIGEAFLVDLVLAFQREYPAVSVELDLSIVRRELVAERYDLALRSARSLEDDLVARPLGVLRELPLASAALLARHGALAHPRELEHVPAVINSTFRDDAHWTFERDGDAVPVTVSGSLHVNSYAAIRRAVLAGAGIARLPLFMVREQLESGALVRVCEGWDLVATPLYLVYPQRRHQPLRTRVFIDFVLRWFNAPELRAAFR